MAGRIAVHAAAEPDVLAVFVPPWRARVDSASELHDGLDAPCDACDCDATPQDRTVAQLRRAALAAGGVLGKGSFVTERLIQSGAFGRVQLVRVDGVDSPLALKTVELHTQADPSTCGSPKFSSLDARRVRRLQQEVALYSALAPARCPLLPTLFDAGLYASGRRAYLAMSYVPGTDLRCRLAASDSGRLPVAVARFFAAEVLLALQVIHDFGFVYRDVKPENVMVNETTAHCVLVDFDLAVRRPDGGAKDELAQWASTPLEEAAQAAALFDATAPAEVSPPTSRRGSLEVDATADGAAGQAATAAPVAGTAEYAAPEVLSGAVHGAAADTWQVGILLFEMLFGETPFAAQRQSKARGVSGELHFGNNELIFRRIRGAALCFLPSLPDEDADAEEAELLSAGVDLLMAMLRRTQAPSDPRVRLGGLCETAVRSHPFFAGLDWEALPHAPAPITILPVRLKGSQMNLADMSRGLED